MEKFRLYKDVLVANNLDSAVSLVGKAKKRQLILEVDELQNKNRSGVDPWYSNAGIEVISDQAGLIELDVTLDGGGAWLFISDANYPGWKAMVNGEESPIHNANILGKAVYLDRGANNIVLEYHAETFNRALIVSTLGLVLLAMFLLLLKNRFEYQ